MLVLDTIENFSFKQIQRSLELVLLIAYDIATGDSVTIINYIIARSCIFQTTKSSFFAEVEVRRINTRITKLR